MADAKHLDWLDQWRENSPEVKSDCLFAWLRQNDVHFGTPTLKSEIRVY